MTQSTRPALTLLLLALTSSAAGQTLIDTSTSIGIQNTLQQGSTGSIGSTLKAAQNVAQTVQTVQQAEQAAAVPAVPAPTPFTAAQTTQLLAAQSLLKENNYPQARAGFEALVAQNYAQPEPHFGLGLALFALGDFKGANFEFTQLSLLAPDRFEGPYNLGVIATRERRYDDALRLYGSAATLARGRVSLTVQRQVLDALAAEQTRAAAYAALVTTLTEIAALAPDDAAVQFRLVQAQTLAGQSAQALPGAYALMQREPSRADVVLLIADIYVAQGLPDRAIRELDAAAPRMATGADRASLLLRKANLLSAGGDTRGAVVAAQAAADADGRSASTFAALGTFRVARNDRPGALTAYLNAVKLAPKNAAYRTDLAAVRLTLGQNAQAFADAVAAIRLFPEAATLARAQYVQGIAAYRQGNFADARAALRSSALKAASADTYFWLGLSQYALKDYVGAATALSESVKLEPSVNARQNLASALLASARYPEAEAILRGLVSDNPKNDEGWYLLGVTQRAQRRESEARQALKTAANLGNVRAVAALK
ncbi:tetratricopeptide repeat protein [Deinococcus aquatilis]|uniref:tetratricopeptide repeat protein n=1 Tax=Deinococcus aquatilis TaxID=519440 RepID=UPI0003A4F032|nr:tetratricopeptide repeat protein [Deinococcus aquatilis]